MVTYPFALRPDYFAELMLPADLTAEEAERIGRFVTALAIAPASEPIDPVLRQDQPPIGHVEASSLIGEDASLPERDRR